MSRIHPLLQKEMTRKQFLLTLGFGFVSLFGFSGLIGMLTGKQREQTQPGYGSNNYGP